MVAAIGDNFDPDLTESLCYLVNNYETNRVYIQDEVLYNSLISLLTGFIIIREELPEDNTMSIYRQLKDATKSIIAGERSRLN